MLPVEWGGEQLVLHAERGLGWPARRTVIIADPHFGKDEVFRRAGVAIPAGILSADLARLGRLVDAAGAERLVVLGDFFHARPDADASFLDELARWRRSRPGLQIDVVAGNHDRGVRAEALDGIVGWHARPLDESPFRLTHEPPDGFEPGFAICGHLHPAVRIGGAGDRLRLPAFWLRRRCAVLPAFGGFTGGALVRAETPGDRLFAVTDETVRELPPRRRRPTGP